MSGGKCRSFTVISYQSDMTLPLLLMTLQPSQPFSIYEQLHGMRRAKKTLYAELFYTEIKLFLWKWLHTSCYSYRKLLLCCGTSVEDSLSLFKLLPLAFYFLWLIGIVALQFTSTLFIVRYVRFLHLACKYESTLSVMAKFHYTDTDPNGPARTQRSFAAKKVRSVSVSVSGPYPCPCSGI